MIYWQYFKYVMRHKWFVFIECAKWGMFWRGITHDFSKLRPSEFFPYARYFYGEWEIDHDSRMALTLSGRAETSPGKRAWLFHQRRNRHHWQYWVVPLDDGGEEVLRMPLRDRVEMFCDWCAMGRVRGNLGVRDWYEENRNKMRLHKDTRDWIEWKIRRLT